MGVAPMPWYADDRHFDRSIPSRQQMLGSVGEALRFYSYWLADR